MKGAAAVLAAVVSLAVGCQRSADQTAGSKSSSAKARVVAASDLARIYGASTISEWRIRARAADGDVLVIEMAVIMEPSMIEAMHYGTGGYGAIVEGGVQRFYREHGFRGVAYRDGSDKIWTFGAASEGAAASLSPPCH